MKYGNTGKVISGRKSDCWTKDILIWIALALMVVVAAGCVEKPQQHEEIILSNYPKLFEKDVIIVVGENATQIESDATKAIAYNMGELTGNEPVTKTYAEVTQEEKSGYNLILVGRSYTNKMLRDVYERTNATKVTDEDPGAGKGVLEILRSPWNESKVMLLVQGSDEWGVRAGSVVLEEKQKIKSEAKVVVDWKEATGIKFPIDSAEEAIKYANTDIRVKEFIKTKSAIGHRVTTSAKFLNMSNNPYAKFLNMTNNWWIVEYQAFPLTSFTMYVNPNGTIIFGGVAT